MRDELMVKLLDRGVDRPANLVAELPDDAVDGAIRWYDDQKLAGKRIGPGLLAKILMEGGRADYGQEPERTQRPWYRNAAKRIEWCDAHFPLVPDEAEAAIISLMQAGAEVTPHTVGKTIRFDRRMDEDFYRNDTQFETAVAEGKPKEPWARYARRASP